ncbi:CBS domain-containing protein [Actinoplanes oblitus]|uniref:CBS domain-containing protein n=1 Tax=Actinoplanes oblitus TaxID=3040509 RepID=A0ABY8W538_9ACTN|nr:CBS domain-containing protein [Actinoplanes oblitus]WIM92951.1 CBS domain-containing protein [Actinoplanes oblitus]
MRTWKVGDVMTSDVVSVGEDTPYRDLVDLLVSKRISAVPVVDDFGRVTGVVSEADLLRKIEYGGDEQPRIFERRRRRGERAKALARTAAGLMSTPAVVALADMSIARTARLMDANEIKRLPVTDDLGRLVGIVSRGDLLRTYLRSDEEIRDDVRAGVLRPFLADEADGVTVEVSDGVVTLSGKVERWASADLAERLSRQVAGVVEVISSLAYDLDDRTLASPRPPFAAY